MNHAAWVAWLECGSREDWSDRVGRLQTPTLVVAGELDEQLGPRTPQALTVTHLAQARLLTLAGAKHLLPLERPADVARLIDNHVQAVLGAARGRDAIGTRDIPQRLITEDMRPPQMPILRAATSSRVWASCR